MTEDEWLAIEAILEAGFPSASAWTPKSTIAYRMLLDGYDRDEVIGTLRTLVRRGSKFRPSPGEIAGEIESQRRGGRTTFEEAYDTLFGRAGLLRRGYADGTVMAALESGDPVVASFVAVRGVTALRQLRIDDPDWGEKIRSDLRREFEGFAENAHERLSRGHALPTGERGRTGLTRASVEGVLEAPGAQRALPTPT